MDIFTNLPDAGENDNFYEAVQALNTYFKPKSNTNFEIFKIHEAAQESEETLNQFYLRLRKMSANCSFYVVDDEIKNQIISKCHNKRLRQRAVEEADITLKKLLDMGNTMEAASQIAISIEGQIKP